MNPMPSTGRAVTFTSTSMKRILVIKLRAIGDVLLATVVLDNLRRAFPAAEIHFLTEPAAAGLLPHEPSLDKILVFDRKRMTGIDHRPRVDPVARRPTRVAAAALQSLR